MGKFVIQGTIPVQPLQHQGISCYLFFCSPLSSPEKTPPSHEEYVPHLPMFRITPKAREHRRQKEEKKKKRKGKNSGKPGCWCYTPGASPVPYLHVRHRSAHWPKSTIQLMHGCISRRWRLMASCFSFSGCRFLDGILRSRRQASDDMTVKACAPIPIRSRATYKHRPSGWSIRGAGGKHSQSRARYARLLAACPKFLPSSKLSLGGMPKVTSVSNSSASVQPMKLHRWRGL